MRVAVLSDIHANRQALEAVLDDVAVAGVDEVWCLGDLVGYGADPDACVELVRDRAAICLGGNHDLAVHGGLPLEEFSRAAAAAARWTREQMAEENVAFLAGLEPLSLEREVDLYHASPRDPVWEYVLSAAQADECLDVQRHRVALVGHSHVALAFTRQDGEPAHGEARREGAELNLAQGDWLVNPGSVGQPRDGDPRAAWALLDTGQERLVFRRTAYDVAAAAAAIRAAGLPDSLAERLRRGQ